MLMQVDTLQAKGRKPRSSLHVSHCSTAAHCLNTSTPRKVASSAAELAELLAAWWQVQVPQQPCVWSTAQSRGFSPTSSLTKVRQGLVQKPRSMRHWEVIHKQGESTALEQQFELHVKNTSSHTAIRSWVRVTQAITSHSVQTELERSHLKDSYSSNADCTGTFSEHCPWLSKPHQHNSLTLLLELWPCKGMPGRLAIEIQLQDHCGQLSSPETCWLKTFVFISSKKQARFHFLTFNIRNAWFTSNLVLACFKE